MAFLVCKCHCFGCKVATTLPPTVCLCSPEPTLLCALCTGILGNIATMTQECRILTQAIFQGKGNVISLTEGTGCVLFI